MLNEIYKGMDNAAEMINGNFENIGLEMGENEYGQWLRIGDWQLCRAQVELTYNSGNLLNAKWIFPKPFIDSDIYLDHTPSLPPVGSRADLLSTFQYLDDNVGSQVTLSLLSGISNNFNSGQSVETLAIAIGRYK